MAKAKEKAGPAADKPVYLMPHVECGDAVLWHDGDEAEPTAMALVTQVGTDAVTLAVLGEGYHNFLVKTGVRHRDHPDKNAIRATDSGVWTHRTGFLKLLQRLEDMEEQLMILRGAAAP